MADAIYSKGPMVQSWLHWESLFVYYIKSEIQTIHFISSNIQFKMCLFLGLITKILYLLIVLGISSPIMITPFGT